MALRAGVVAVSSQVKGAHVKRIESIRFGLVSRVGGLGLFPQTPGKELAAEEEAETWRYLRTFLSKSREMPSEIVFRSHGVGLSPKLALPPSRGPLQTYHGPQTSVSCTGLHKSPTRQLIRYPRSPAMTRK